MLLLGEGSEATKPYNKYDKNRPHSIRSLQFDQKVRPLSFRPEKFDLFTATHGVIHQLPLNDKCSQLSFTSHDDKYFFNAKMISKTDCQKDLGVFISSDLKWDIHLKNAALKALNVFFLIKRNSPSLPFTIKINLYKSMVLPTLTYGSNCWSATNVTNMKLLENVQKRFWYDYQLLRLWVEP